MEAGQTSLVVLALVGIVGLDVADVVAGQLVDGLLDLQQSSGLSHLQRGKVGVGPGSIPVALRRKGSE